MTLATAPIFGMLEEKMNWLTQRQRVIAQNIANADTPQYRARDLQPLDFRRELGQNNFKFHLKRTHPAHMGAPHHDYNFREEKALRSYEHAPMKNNVILEEQMMKLTAIQSDYRLATKVFTQYKNMYQMALGRPGG